MSLARLEGVDLHYWQIGRGPDLVLLHGLIGNLAVWHLKIVPLLQRSYRLTTYDLRGHGRSSMPAEGYTTRDMADDLKRLLDFLELEQIDLVGHSFGADIALHFAILYPERVRRLILLEAGLAVTLEQRKRESWQGWRYWVGKLAEVGIEVPPERQSDFHYLLNLSLNTPKFYGPARSFPRRREPLLRLINTTTIVRDYEEVAGLTLEYIATLSTPTLVIYGEKSHFLESFQLLARTLPYCQTALLPGGEHFGPLEQPELLVEHLRRFLGAEGEGER